MRIDIWSDFACPFCYIGKRNLEKALEEFNSSEKIEIIYHSFQLNPDAEKASQGSSVSNLSKKYGISEREAQRMIDRTVSMAEDVGLSFNYHKLIETNTFDAHRLAYYAKSQNKAQEVIERLFKAYFTDGLNIGDHLVLADLAKELGLNKEEALKILDSKKYTEEVEEDKYSAQQFGITSVPFFVINNKTAVPGAQSSDIFLQVLQEA